MRMRRPRVRDGCPHSDLTRSRAAFAGSLLVTGVAFLVAVLWGGILPHSLAARGVAVWMVLSPTWLLFYLWFTHVELAPLDASHLKSYAHESARRRSVRRFSFLGWTTARGGTARAACSSVAAIVFVANSGELRSQAVFVVLAMVNVVAAWLFMIYGFAEEYLERHAAGLGAVEFEFDDEPRFGDYLTLAVALTTMTASAPARMTSSALWSVARTNILLAFLVNSTIIAMAVAFVFGAIS